MTADEDPTELRRVHVQNLKLLVERNDYVVDPVVVAEALLRRTDPRRDPVLLPPVIRPHARTRSAGGRRRGS